MACAAKIEAAIENRQRWELDIIQHLIDHASSEQWHQHRGG